VTETPRRELPPLPNLDRLKKEAKARLAEMRQRAPSTQLSDAQHLLAREHGFANWAGLKTEVEKRAASAGADSIREGRARGALHRAETRLAIQEEPESPASFFRTGITMIVMVVLVAILVTLLFLGTDKAPERFLGLWRASMGRGP
jgi:hypothetical protein